MNKIIKNKTTADIVGSLIVAQVMLTDKSIALKPSLAGIFITTIKKILKSLIIYDRK